MIETNFAFTSNGGKILLRNLDKQEAVFSSGFWRYQNPFNKETKIIRDKEFVIGEQLSIIEKNNFKYFHAKLVGKNCYGKYESNTEYIVANYGNNWAYGESLPSVRAFLGNKLFHLYKNILDEKILQQSVCKK
jgi:hypothetical protein